MHLIIYIYLTQKCIAVYVSLHISGILYKYYGSYFVVFICAGCPPIIGSILMCGMYMKKATHHPAKNEEITLPNI